MRKTDQLIIENAEILFRNFEGREEKYNPAGRRNFCVLINHEDAPALLAEGWNIKELNPRDEGDEPQPYLQVAVSFANVPPNVILVTGQGKTLMTEETIGMLDWVEIKEVDLIITPYHWEVNGKSGIKAYTKSLYITIIEDAFASKYYDVDVAEDALNFYEGD